MRRSVEEQIKQRSGGVCEVCGRRLSADWGLRGWLWSIHHRRNRGMGGSSKRPHTDCSCNLLVVCGNGTVMCHGWITEHPTTASQRGLTVSKYRDEPWRDKVKLHDGWFILRCDGSRSGLAEPETA